MSELTMLIDTTTGVMLLGHSHLSADVLDKVTAIAGEGKECGCARPTNVLPVPITRESHISGARDQFDRPDPDCL